MIITPTVVSVEIWYKVQGWIAMVRSAADKEIADAACCRSRIIASTIDHECLRMHADNAFCRWCRKQFSPCISRTIVRSACGRVTSSSPRCVYVCNASSCVHMHLTMRGGARAKAMIATATTANVRPCHISSISMPLGHLVGGPHVWCHSSKIGMTRKETVVLFSFFDA